ncbi:hypothetical protein PR048_020198 [Dryococelus australis]|uniref:Integrase zinc-binding domain-containing protein n=1 Tax=Dryococelus australis TaxID=614101 RepID=A0ABQ9H5M4_9NEOP|nr:hypothetical protein PR048_020198 [Dryococelus australis]
MKLHTPNGERKLTLVPKYYVPEIITVYHDALLGGGHFGQLKTIEKIKTANYWDSMNKDIRDYPPRLLESWCLDAKGPLLTSVRGNKYILATRCAITIPVKAIDAPTCANFITDVTFYSETPSKSSPTEEHHLIIKLSQNN